MNKIHQAFIFAAGRGSRMRPLTDSIPKPLVKIKNKAIIDYTIEKLVRVSGIRKIIINGFYLAEQVRQHIAELNNPKIIFSHELEKLETGGGLMFAKDKIDFEQPLLTLNGDVLWQESLTSDIELICQRWQSANCDILLGLKRKEDYVGYDGNAYGGGDFNFDVVSGELTRINDAAMSHVFVGMQIINPKILERIDEKCFSMSVFYRPQQGDGDVLRVVKGVELQGKYFHVGTVDAIKEVEQKMRQ